MRPHVLSDSIPDTFAGVRDLCAGWAISHNRAKARRTERLEFLSNHLKTTCRQLEPGLLSNRHHFAVDFAVRTLKAP